MGSRLLWFLLGSVYIYYQVLALTEEIYFGELMVESNVTLEANTIVSILNATSTIQVTDSNGVTHDVVLLYNELVAECVSVGDEFSCNCSTGYIWSNAVCYTYNCCRETTCTANVTHMVPLCIPKDPHRINGTVLLNAGSWDLTKTTSLTTAFEVLNGFEFLNVTGQRMADSVADFEVAVSAKFDTWRLQKIVTDLEVALDSVVWVDTEGFVTIVAPNSTVCYMASPKLKCMWDEPSYHSGFNITRPYERFELNQGLVVDLDYACADQDFPSCVAVTINGATGIWSGIYECGFTVGSVRHTAKREVRVALLPDEITMLYNPLTVDCSEKGPSESVSVAFTVIIDNTTASYDTWWTYRGGPPNTVNNDTVQDKLHYTFSVPFSCTKIEEAQFVNVTFKNILAQEKTQQAIIPVIYQGETFCAEEALEGELWPKTPDGDTVVNQSCVAGRVGIKTRTCEGTNWMPVFSECINEDLAKVVDAADNFLKGLGATQDVAMDIFADLKNSSVTEGEDSMADLGAGIDILNVMSRASANVDLDDEVLPDLVDGASNMLNKTWEGVNQSVVHDMSANYLESMENLVRNIRINNSDSHDTENLQLKFCSSADCNVTVFGVAVNLNKTAGLMKTMGVRNLMDKLYNNYDDSVTNSVLLSATLTGNNDSTLNIKMDFPSEEYNFSVPHCVFWNTSLREWAEDGCFVKEDGDNGTQCECHHLTSFSVLMSKSDVSNDVLDMITSVGLGISVCCLVIFLGIEAMVWGAVVKSNLSLYRHTSMVNIATFLLLAMVSFLASTHPTLLSDGLCLTFTVTKHLFFLAMFCWMMCLSCMLVHSLIFVFNPLRKRVFMFLSSFVGYVCPILIVGSSYIYYRYTNKPYYNRATCWLDYERILVGSIHAFFIPLGLILIVNIFSLAVVVVTLVKTSEGNKDDKDTAKAIFKVMLFLTPVFGVTWIIGFLLLIMDAGHPLHTFANYAFTILNSFQGLFILLAGVMAEPRVREEVIRIVTRKEPDPKK